MLKRLLIACIALILLSTLPSTPAQAADDNFLDRYAYNPFAVALAVAGAGISVATAANAVNAAATAVGIAAEAVVTGVTVAGGATLGMVVGTGVGVGTVLVIGTGELTGLFEAIQGTALAFQGR